MAHASPIELVVDDELLYKKFNRFGSLIPMMLHVAMLDSMREVGFQAVSKYMLHTPGPHDGKLGMRTTELMRSLTEGFGFTRVPGGTRWSIRQVKFEGENVIGIFGSKLPYARIHEFGGEYTHTNLWGRGITAKIHMPARPYLRPALKSAEPKIHSFFKNAMQKLVRKIGGIT